MSKKKKIIVMSSLVLLLALTAVLNVVLARTKTAKGDSALYDANDEKYKEAVNLKIKIVEIMEKELVLETMIKSKGFSDAVVSIGVDSDNVNVFINSNELDINTALSIYHCLKDEAGIIPENIIIMPVYSQI